MEAHWENYRANAGVARCFKLFEVIAFDTSGEVCLEHLVLSDGDFLLNTQIYFVPCELHCSVSDSQESFCSCTSTPYVRLLIYHYHTGELKFS